MGSTTRISGLSTGLDWETWIDDLMKAQRTKLDTIEQKKQKLEWQQEDYRTINSSLLSLKNSALNMKLQGTYLTRTVTSSDESVVRATAGSSATGGVYTIKVDQLAKAAYVTSTASLGSGTDTSTLQKQFGLASAEDITLEINGVQLTINTGTEGIEDLVDKINDLTNTDGTSIGVSASYDATTDRLFLSTAKTGSSAQINIQQVSPDPSTGTNLLSLLKMDSYTYPVTGQNAIFDLNGADNIEQSTNEFTIAGVKYNLVGTSTEAVTLKLSYDTDAVYNSIKSFIEQYNTTLELINSELSETRYKDYNPLTDGEREELSDTQQEQWEEKAKSGLLKNDLLLSSITNKMRASISGVVSGIESVTVGGKKVTYDNLAAIGITTSIDYTEGGKLYLSNDGEDLKKAIENDPEGIMNLFTQDGDGKEEGIARRLYDSLDWAVDTIVTKAGSASVYSSYDNSTIGKQLVEYDEQIDMWEDRLENIEDQYWAQFTAMEQAIAQMNSQSQWLSQQFNSGS